MLGFATHSSFSFFYKKGGDGLENLTRALVMVDPLHQSSLLCGDGGSIAPELSVVRRVHDGHRWRAVCTPVPDCRVTGLQYQTVVCELDAGGPVVALDWLQYQTVVSLDWTPVPDCRVWVGCWWTSSSTGLTPVPDCRVWVGCWWTSSSTGLQYQTVVSLDWLQYQTVVCELDAGGPVVALPDDTRRLQPTALSSNSFSNAANSHRPTIDTDSRW